MAASLSASSCTFVYDVHARTFHRMAMSPI